MTERNIAAEVFDGLREIGEFRTGRRTLRAVRVEPRPLPELTPDTIREIRDRLDVSRAVFAHMIRVPGKDRGTLGTGQVPPAPLCRSTDPHGAEIPRYLRSSGLSVN